VLLCLARIVITTVARRIKTVGLTDKQKKAWGETLEEYMNYANSDDEQAVYNDDGNTYKDYKKMIDDIKTMADVPVAVDFFKKDWVGER